MPAEWERHQATWMSWPFDDDMWFGRLREVRSEYEALVRTIAKYETVHLLLRDGEAWDSATNALSDAANIKFHPMPLDDVWMRDNGPIFIRGAASKFSQKGPSYAYVNWGFNAWGDKYDSAKDNLVPERLASTLGLSRFEPRIIMEGGSLDVDGLGTCLTTKQCLLTPTRNPTLSPSDIERYLSDYLGISRLIWLNDGLEGDHTDGHVDTITRFVAPGVVVTSVTDQKSDPNYLPMHENLEILKSEVDARGLPLKVVELPLPKEPIYLDDGTRLPATYANFYFVNSAVLVPQYGDPNDHKALAILQALIPDRKVVGLSSRNIIVGGGSFHCLTQQQPEVG
jgi:agmatine deiminase